MFAGPAAELSPDKPPKPLDQLVSRIAPRPIFLIEVGHGSGGERLDALYYKNAGSPKTLWPIPQAHHTQASRPVRPNTNAVSSASSTATFSTVRTRE